MYHSHSKKLSLLMAISMAAIFIFATVKMLHHVEPYYSWYYSFAWWSYIITAQCLLYIRGKPSLLWTSPAHFFALAAISISVWLIFEIFNFRLQNWHYEQLPNSTVLRWFGYTVSFSTVLPGIFTTSAILQSLGAFGSHRISPISMSATHYAFFISLGILFLALPLAWPNYFFPFIWGAFIFLLEPINFRLAVPSVLSDLQKGSLRVFYVLMTSGLICGFLWEFWNFWAGSKWVYSIPFVGWLKIFEMPILGFLGFPPFAVECYAIWNSIYAIMKSIKNRRRLASRFVTGTIFLVFIILFDLAVYTGIDHFTVLSFAN